MNTHGLLLLGLLTGDSASLLLALALLQESLGDEDMVLSGDGAVKVSLVCPCKICIYSPSVRTAAIARHSQLKARNKEALDDIYLISET